MVPNLRLKEYIRNFAGNSQVRQCVKYNRGPDNVGKYGHRKDIKSLPTLYKRVDRSWQSRLKLDS